MKRILPRILATAPGMDDFILGAFGINYVENAIK